MPSFVQARFATWLLAGTALAVSCTTAAAGPKAYVGNFADNSVSVIDTTNNMVVATVPVAAGPHGMAISRDGATVYVTGDGHLKRVTRKYAHSIRPNIVHRDARNGVRRTLHGDRIARLAEQELRQAAHGDTAGI